MEPLTVSQFHVNCTAKFANLVGGEEREVRDDSDRDHLFSAGRSAGASEYTPSQHRSACDNSDGKVVLVHPPKHEQMK